MVEPVLKWAGGKRQILSKIRGCLPPENAANAFHEPMFGGGALFFDTGPHDAGTINDINERLINFYRVVRDNPDELVETLQTFEKPGEPPDNSREFSDVDRDGDEIENYYYQQRALYNRRPSDEEFDPVEEAALLLYLNRTCYNGLYRENQDGEFNVPIGRHTSTNWVQSSRIYEANKYLQGIEILDGDFEYVREYAKEDDLVYFDPPYRPVSHTSSFVEYSSESFGSDEQKRLAKLVKDLHECGVYVVLSNSPPTKELYRTIDGIQIHEVGAKRQINSNAEDRGEVGEIIITNIDPDNRREKTVELDQFQESST